MVFDRIYVAESGWVIFGVSHIVVTFECPLGTGRLLSPRLPAAFSYLATR